MADAFHPDRAFINALKHKAVAIAESDLARFENIDAQYRDKVETYPDPNPGNPFRLGMDTYMKWYRDFTGYEVKDIRRSDSLLKPIVYVIDFNCNVMGTKHWAEDQRDSFLGVDPVKNAELETEFELKRQISYTREYSCDAYGEYDGALPDTIPRGGYFTLIYPPSMLKGGAGGG